MHFVGEQTVQKIVGFYSDKAPELEKAAIELGWKYDHSTPAAPQNNGVAENKVKDVINGGRRLLLQAGLPAKFWPYATRMYCISRNMRAREGDSPWLRMRSNIDFAGKGLPFGCLVDRE